MTFLVFLLGNSIGSFIGVLIYRNLTGESPIKGRSHCDHCQRQLAWYENIPLFSFVMLGGKCRTCKKKIPWTYPLVELMSGILFVWWMSLGFLFFNLTRAPLLYVQPVFWLIMGIILLVIFFADWFYGIIPDFAVGLMALLTVLYRGYLVVEGAMKLPDFLISVVVAIAMGGAFLALYLLTRGKGMGFGDVKFAPVMAFLLGYPRALVGFFSAFLIGGLVGVGLIATGKKKWKQAIPLGPFLVMGLILALVWGEEVWRWYLGML